MGATFVCYVYVCVYMCMHTYVCGVVCLYTCKCSYDFFNTTEYRKVNWMSKISSYVGEKKKRTMLYLFVV